MCGIGGKVSFRRRPEVGLGERMAAPMNHRGPDAEGVYANGPALLSHRRLSIFDPTPAGNQPMANEDGTVHVVFNGEIYNHPELRADLADHTFRSGTDTEVLLALYEEDGVDCLDRLNGMFAFAIWDERRERLFLARDRLGQKPLFYRHEEGVFWFGSSIKAILADDAVPRTPDPDALREFLTYHYVPAPATGFAGIAQLEPGEYAVFDDNGVQRERYWSPSFADQSTASLSTLQRRLRNRLRESVRLRMRSDVPVGVFLSGGLDSSIVTALATEVADEPVDTYSVGFAGESGDEREYSRIVADAFDTNHHEEAVSIDVAALLPTIVDHYEMPFGDPSAIPTYYVSEVAAADKKVVIGGDGGDELFAGYSRYTRDWLLGQIAKVPTPLLAGAGRALSWAGADRPETRRYYARRLCEIANGDEIERHAALVCHATGDRLDSVFAEGGPDDQFRYLRSKFETADGPTLLDRMTDVDLRTYLPNAILTKVDRATMAHSLEARAPFLDHTFVEFAARIPARYKWHRGSKKWILRRTFDDDLPDEILERDKSGFGAPIGRWIRDDLRDAVPRKLDRLGERPLFDAAGIDSQYEDHVAGVKDHGNRIWNQFMLELWFERFIDGDPLEI